MRTVSPIHFFDERGNSVLSIAHLETRVAELEAENDNLRDRVRSLSVRLRALAGEEEEATSSYS